METALLLSKRNLGNTAPNPSVGCVIENNGIVVGRGWTAIGGRPHAETIALKQAGEKAKGATLYVTLEPCSHQGETPPCVDAIIKAGIAKVVFSMEDPNPKVNGKGTEALKKAGIDVILWVGEEEAEEINKGFILTQTENRPLVALKFATSLDGKIALASGESKWITNDKSRHYAHFLRSQHDAIVVGIGTVLADNPMLNCRINGLEHKSPIRIIMDTNLRIPLESKLVQTARDIPTWIFGSGEKQKALEKHGVKVFEIHKENTGDVRFFLTKLAKNGITRLLVEGGATLATSFVKSGLFDDIYWFYGSQIMGGDAKSAVNALDINTMNEIRRLTTVETKKFDNDRVIKLCQK